MKLPSTLERMMFGFIESQVLFVCNEIGIFDYLEENGPSKVDKISKDLDLPASSLDRLLICATSLNLLEKNKDKYKVAAEFRPFLIRKSKYYCGARFSHYWKSTYKVFDHLVAAIQENKSQWGKIEQNREIDDAFNSVYTSSIYSDETSTQDFLATMWASGYEDSVDLCKKYSLKGYAKLVDVGGATGSFAIAALQENPHLAAEVMDYPLVKPYAEEAFQAYNVSNRACFHAGDIFKDTLPKADAYSIGYVLSDWPQELCLALIKKVYENLPPNGLIIILEKFFNKDKTGPYLTAMLNLTMLLEMHGTHRTASEYIGWLKDIGFTNYQTIYSSGEKHMIVAQKG
ncbi:methyltransferase [Candidatus Paracaedibacter symbiosus]|uniref:methyltransferase n=1 Tax=Candidatus Paracaedibacter symbiosus TaxID=244582 RepID=UPI00068D1607|nr:methyltransferase [Candidatus Paracaedibacter symbiosus]